MKLRFAVIKPGTLVRVYRNLHNNCFSVQVKKNGQWKVVLHTDFLMVEEVEFKVSRAGRNRVLQEKKKNVHAFVVGKWMEANEYGLVSPSHVTYNPYKADYFYRSANGIVDGIRKAPYAVLTLKKQSINQFNPTAPTSGVFISDKMCAKVETLRPVALV